MNNLLNFWLFRKLFLLRKIFLTSAKRTYYSQYGEDITLDRVVSIGRKGFFVDVGCHHPIKYSNTFKLYRHGWRGINIDLDPLKIEAFNLRRPGDVNICSAVSDTDGEVTAYSQGVYTVTETIDPEAAEKMRSRGNKLREFTVKSRRLTDIIDQTRYRDQRIDVLTIDVEGVELAVLHSLDMKRYRPKVIIVESHERHLDKLMQTEVYQLLVGQNYQLFNWTGPSLLFLDAQPDN